MEFMLVLYEDPELIATEEQHKDAVRRVGEHKGTEKNGNDSDRNIDQKNPAPGIVVGDPAPDRRADGRSDQGSRRVGGHGHAVLFSRKTVYQNRLRGGLQASSSGSLEHTKEHQQGQARREPAEQRAQREESGAADEEPLAPDQLGKPPRQGQHDGVGHQVRSQYPGALVDPG